MIVEQQDWVVVSAGERQSKEFIRKAERAALVLCEAHGIPTPRVTTESITLHNGARLMGLPSKPGTVRGYTANVILDEFAFHDDAPAVWQAIMPSITNPLAGDLKLRVVSSAGGQSGKFFDIVQRHEELGYTLHTTTVNDAIQGGLDLNAQELRRAIGDEEIWAQEYLCQFIDSASVLLPYELISRCEHTQATEDGWDSIPYRGTEVYLGIDIGRKHDLTVCWTLERVGDVLWTRDVLVLDRVPYNVQQEIISARIARASGACIDSTGIGGPISEALAEQHDYKLEQCNFTAPFKSKIFPALRRAFSGRRLRIPKDETIREDLHSMRKLVTQSGAEQYRAPHNIDGHADRCNALALACRAAEQSMDDAHTVRSTQGIIMARPRIRREVLI
jgi:phage FluMu gp28-like protein